MTLLKRPSQLLGVIAILCLVSMRADQAVAECTLDCRNGGKCRLGTAEFGFSSEMEDMGMLHGDPDAYTDKGRANRMHCICPTGFTGIQCEIKLADCGNDGTCFNGEECEEDEDDFGNPLLHCECDANKSDLTLPYSGHFCRNIGHVFCAATEDENQSVHYSHSFCANGGRCRHNLSHRDQE